MLYRYEKTSNGYSVYLMTLSEIWKTVYKKDKNRTLLDVRRLLEREEKEPVWFGDKGEQYYFIYAKKNYRNETIFQLWDD